MSTTYLLKSVMDELRNLELIEELCRITYGNSPHTM